MPNKIAEKIRGVFFKLLMEFPVERLRDFEDQRSSLVLPFQLETVIKSSDLKKKPCNQGDFENGSYRFKKTVRGRLLNAKKRLI